MQKTEDYLKLIVAMLVALLITTVVFPVALFFVVWGVLTVIVYVLIDYVVTKLKKESSGDWRWK